MTTDTYIEPLQHPETLSVMLIDDDPLVHEIMQLYLANTRFRLISASNAIAALEIMTARPPDIVITDAMMPEMSGYSLISKMKTDQQLAEIPVILWTILEEVNGSVMDSTQLADIRISKPFYTADIMGTLKRAVDLLEFRRGLKVKVDLSDLTLQQ